MDLREWLQPWLYGSLFATGMLLTVQSVTPPSSVLTTTSATNKSPETPMKLLSEKGRKELSKNITHILNNLVDERHYDKRLRPNYGGPPVDVGITIYVSSISAVSEVEMDFTLDFYLRQMWWDPRLEFQQKYGLEQDLTVGIEYLHHIWVPDTFFPNEKKSFFHKATTHNSFLRISSDGNVKTSQRLTVTANCPMQLRLFPLDSQKCSLEIESYGYTMHEINLDWAYKSRPPEVGDVMSGKIELPQFKHDIIAPYTNQTVVVLSSGPYSRLSVCFWFIRSIGFYMIQIYVPAILIVIISWVSFWLSRDAAPARVALGVTTVLTMTTLMTTTNSSLPKVSYIKSIDLYLGTCFVMVFASLLEYAWVGYTNKKMKMSKTRRMSRQDFATTTGPVEYPMPPIPSPAQYRQRMEQYHHSSAGGVGGGGSLMSPLLRDQPAGTAGFVGGWAEGMKYRGVGGSGVPPPSSAIGGTGGDMMMANSLASLACDCDIPPPLSPSRILLRIQTPGRRIRGITASMIDKWSRIIFPSIFIIFNVTYWGVFYYVKAKYKLKAEESKIASDVLQNAALTAAASNK